ncbi:MAG: hypothetical protein A3C35_00880 [Omnitrophica bacterium RIFCSPHIGHO2_02_FULL_46_11]|nr:MAG: hypothetical protein A3C35_00880 [Omnitrophica bacterium RIFCSPHIGHO2_02_FULL_46_11]OGW86803.1 MAG: hypothetical protein A3A81_04040 [Omnitrophica bacterium RIFCSPLOWO2_01_FULL_45_10b]
MAKGKSSSGSGIATAAIYVFLVAVLGTYFLPIVGVNLPAFGRKSWGVRDIVKTIPKGTSKKADEKKQLTPQYDFMDLVKEVSPRNPDNKTAVKVSPEFIFGAMVPVALALTYLFSVLGLLIASLRKGGLFVLTSALAFITAFYSLVGTYLLSQAAHRAFSDSVAKVAESPFGIIAKNLVQQITVQPDSGLYALVVLTGLVFVVGIYRLKQD